MKLTVNDLSYSYTKDVPVLKGVSFTAEKGEFLSVLGPNGAGKSTLFRCLLGGIDGYSGSIELDGREVRGLSRREMAARIAYIPQIHRPTFGYSVLDTALMGLTRELSPFRSPTAEQVLQRVAELAARGYTVILSTHDPQYALRFSQRVLALRDGQVAAFGDTREVLTESLLERLYGVDAALLDTEHGPVVVPKGGGHV